MMDIPSIAEAGAAIAAGRLSPVALTEACLARIDQHEKRVHSFIRLERDRALGAARTAEAEIKAGRRRGDLHGIPFAYKDIYQTAGIPTTAHSKLLIEHLPTCDATTVTKLGEAGVVSFGKLATHEFAIGGPSFDLPFPPPCNPWSIEHFTGGSSSGTGAAVAAGFVLGGTGSDTGGSIRTPSAFCGLAGIKPTYGLVSRAGILPLSFTLDHAGPMAWTVEDCAILLQAMVGHDRADPASANLPIPDYRAELAGGIKDMSIGVIRHLYERDTTVTPEVGAAMALQEKLARVMTDVDLLILPSTPGPAPLIKDVSSYGLFEIPNFTMPFNVVGTPALSLCNGYSAGGLPLSLQIVGRPFEDATVLRAGHAHENATSWKERRPQL